jgi:hypothetical protein
MSKVKVGNIITLRYDFLIFKFKIKNQNMTVIFQAIL